MPEHDILTLEEVAQYLRVSERTVYDWAQKGDIPCGKLGTSWRFKRSEIERWVDSRIAAKPQALRPPHASPAPVVGAQAAAAQKLLRTLLTPNRVVFVEAAKKEGVLNSLIDVLAEAPEVTDRGAIEREIFARETLMSTGIGFSVAVPHVRLDSVKNVIMAVGLTRHAITDYDSLDEQPIRIVCMLAARTDQHAQYLKALGAVSSMLKDAGMRNALLAAPDTASVYRLLTGA